MERRQRRANSIPLNNHTKMQNNIQTKEIEVYKQKTNTIVFQAQNLKIRTDKDMVVAVDKLSEIKAIGNKIREIKEKYTKPANEILKTARAMFGPLEERFREAEKIIKEKMVVFDEIKRTIALEKTKEIAEQVEAGKLDIAKAGEMMEKIEPKNQYEGNEGVMQYRTVKKIVILDEAKIPRRYLLPNEVLIRKDMLSGIKIPGCELREEKIVAVPGIK